MAGHWRVGLTSSREVPAGAGTTIRGRERRNGHLDSGSGAGMTGELRQSPVSPGKRSVRVDRTGRSAKAECGPAGAPFPFEPGQSSHHRGPGAGDGASRGGGRSPIPDRRRRQRHHAIGRRRLSHGPDHVGPVPGRTPDVHGIARRTGDLRLPEQPVGAAAGGGLFRLPGGFGVAGNRPSPGTGGQLYVRAYPCPRPQARQLVPLIQGRVRRVYPGGRGNPGDVRLASGGDHQRPPPRRGAAGPG